MSAHNKPARHILLLLCLFLLLSSSSVAGERVFDYKAVFKPYYESAGKIKIAIRRFRRAGKNYILSLDPYSFDTKITGAKESPEASGQEDTPFIKALNRFTSPEEGLQNMGIKTGGTTRGVFLTVDMCPSKKGFDKDLFESTLSLPQFKDSPAPIAIAVSGLWIEKHRDDLEWILSKEKSGRLNVTWINHTYSHPYAGKGKLEGDFMLKKGVDFVQEVLKGEILMIESGITPSPFFRFPGLVSNSDLLQKLKALSLIPVGASAWLAKGGEPEGGSIILVHGNGNEEDGIKRLKEFYKREDEDFKSGGITLLPLKDAFIPEER